jgi:hypothetical protein
VTPDPYRLHLGNRGTLTILATNVLGAVDALMHGSAHTRGWGAATSPDATLLAVRGFDPATHRFHYSLNPAFGTTSAARSAFSAPFSLTMSLRIDLGPDLETRALNAFFAAARPTPSAPPTPLAIRSRLSQAAASSRVVAILTMQDSLHLSESQADSITRIVDAFQRTRDLAYDELAVALADRAGDFGGDAGRHDWHETLTAVMLASVGAWAEIRAVLSDEQYALIPPWWKIGDDVSRESLEQRLRRPISYPP